MRLLTRTDDENVFCCRWLLLLRVRDSWETHLSRMHSMGVQWELPCLTPHACCFAPRSESDRSFEGQILVVVVFLLVVVVVVVGVVSVVRVMASLAVWWWWWWWWWCVDVVVVLVVLDGAGIKSWRWR